MFVYIIAFELLYLSSAMTSAEAGAQLELPGRGKRVLALAELLPPPAKRRARGGFAPHDECQLLLGDIVRLGSGIGVDAALQALERRACEVERDVRAALPRVFGVEAREAFEERTGVFCQSEGAAVQEADALLRELLPHVFGGRTGNTWQITTQEDFEVWLGAAHTRLREAAAAAGRALGLSSESEGEDYEENEEDEEDGYESTVRQAS